MENSLHNEPTAQHHHSPTPSLPHAFVSIILAVSLAVLAGCGGGGGGGGGSTRITVSGFASVPAGSSLAARSASPSRSASAITGLVSATDTTPINFYTMSSNGTLSSSLVSTTVSNGSFTATLPSSITALSSNLVVVAGSCSGECMHAFVTKTTGVNINPVSEFVKQQVIAFNKSLSLYTLTEHDTIYSDANTAAGNENINFSSAASVSEAVNLLASNDTVLTTTQNSITIAACGSASFFLHVNSPDADGKIYNSQSITVSGSTLACGASVTVNGAAVTVDSNGDFSTGATISSNPTTITVQATFTDTTHTVARDVYYQNSSKCTLVYTATDPRTGATRIYDVDPDIPDSARRISDDVANSTDSAPAISPDRSTVAFIRNLDGDQNIYTIACTGSASAVKITSTGNVHYESVSWSKDGSTLAYASDLANDYDIFTIPPSAGQSFTQITTHTANDTSPAWNSSGKIIFASNRDTGGAAGTISQTHLWRVTPGGTPSIIYDPANASAPACSAGAGLCSASSPDVNSYSIIVFLLAADCSASRAAAAGSDTPSGTCNNIYYLPSGSTYPAAATTGSNIFLHPRWSETTTSVVFVNRNSGTDSLYQLPFSDSTPSSTSSLGLTGGSPDW